MIAAGLRPPQFQIMNKLTSFTPPATPVKIPYLPIKWVIYTPRGDAYGTLALARLLSAHLFNNWVMANIIAVLLAVPCSLFAAFVLASCLSDRRAIRRLQRYHLTYFKQWYGSRTEWRAWRVWPQGYYLFCGHGYDLCFCDYRIKAHLKRAGQPAFLLSRQLRCAGMIDNNCLSCSQRSIICLSPQASITRVRLSIVRLRRSFSRLRASSSLDRLSGELNSFFMLGIFGLIKYITQIST